MQPLEYPLYSVFHSDFQKIKCPLTVEELNQLRIEHRLQNYFFINQSCDVHGSSHGYELIINRDKKIPTRENSWHDTLNALVWMTFPNLKRTLNYFQCLDFKSTQNKIRTARQNLLAHFDEDGIILLHTDCEFIDKLKNHEWMRIFHNESTNYGLTWKVWGFGHGLMEKCLQPYIGLTAKAMLIQVNQDFFKNHFQSQIEIIDDFLSKTITQQSRLLCENRLQPFPLLGVPGWYPGQCFNFYKNNVYFREVAKNKKIVLKLKL